MIHWRASICSRRRIEPAAALWSVPMQKGRDGAKLMSPSAPSPRETFSGYISCSAGLFVFPHFHFGRFSPFLICHFRRSVGGGFGKLLQRTEIGIENKERLSWGHFGVIAGHVRTTFFSTPPVALRDGQSRVIIMVDSYRGATSIRTEDCWSTPSRTHRGGT